jgi:hypothetical protein
MAAPTLAWGNQNLYRLPDDGGHIFGREFELLPAGTMFAANVILHGVAGVSAEPAHEGHCYIEEGGPLLIVGTRNTSTRELEGYQDDIAEGYRLREAQQAQG